MSSNQSASLLAEQAGRARKDVHITSHEGHVDHDTIRLSQSAGEEMTWHSHENRKAMIAFASPDGSPFMESQFSVPVGGSVSSGPVRGAAQKKSYKYTVIGECGVNDPVIIIDK